MVILGRGGAGKSPLAPALGVDLRRQALPRVMPEAATLRDRPGRLARQLAGLGVAGLCHALSVHKVAGRERTARFMRRYQELSDQERGLAVMALLANAVATLILRAVLAVAGIWSVRQCWRARRLGIASVLQAGFSPALAVAAAANIAHWAVRTWAIRAVDAGRGQIWLERMEHWLSDRAARSNPGRARPSEPPEPTPTDA